MKDLAGRVAFFLLGSTATLVSVWVYACLDLDRQVRDMNVEMHQLNARIKQDDEERARRANIPQVSLAEMIHQEEARINAVAPPPRPK